MSAPTPLRTSAEIYLRGQPIAAEKAVEPLRVVSAAEQKHAAEHAAAEARLAGERARAIELQDQFEEFKQRRITLRRAIDRITHGAATSKQQLATLNGEVDHLLQSEDWRFHDHVAAVLAHQFIIDRADAAVAWRKTELASVEKDLAAFCKTHGVVAD
jgi:septal ring factor EnvC (AmiA/AmiB activator)